MASEYYGGARGVADLYCGCSVRMDRREAGGAMKRAKFALSSRGVYERPVLEEDVLGEIRQMLELNKALVFRSIERVPKCYRCGLWLGASEAGTPDLSGYFRIDASSVIPFWFEVKRPKKNVKRLAQIACIERIQRDGGCAAFVESWKEVLAVLDKYGIPVKVRG